MDVVVERALHTEREILRNLMQLYAYDFSELIGLEVEPDGRFTAPPLDAYWNDPQRIPYLLRRGGHLAGFALVHRGSRLSGDADVWDMAEFFVLRKHRRSGVGSEAARQAFAMHRGKWEVRERRENSAATAFWRRAIGDFTRNHFLDVDVDDERWRGPVQSFTSGEPPSL